MPEVQRAGPTDFDDLLRLFERFYREEGFDDAVDGVADNLRQILARADTAAFVARIGAKAVGGAAVSTSFGLEAGLYAELEDLYVDPKWREGGVASALVEAAVDWARGEGCHDVEIVLTPRARINSGLAAWYKARGFENTERVIYERSL